MKLFISIVIVLILGALIGFIIFAYDPFGLRYEYVAPGNSVGFYRIDRLSGKISICAPWGGLTDPPKPTICK